MKKVSKQETWIKNNDLQFLTKKEQDDAYWQYKFYLADFEYYTKKNQASDKNIYFKDIKNDDIRLKVLAIALKHFAPKFVGKILMKVSTPDRDPSFVHVNPDIIGYFDNVLNDDYAPVSYSNSGFVDRMSRDFKIEILFEGRVKNKEKTPHLRSGKFFPYYNNSDLNLDIYGIYRNSQAADNCLITAIENSKVLNNDELNFLKDSIHTLSVSRCELTKISELFDVNIKCFDITYDDKYKDGKSSKMHYYGKGKHVDAKRKLDLILLYYPKYNVHHFMIDLHNLTTTDPKKIPEDSIVKLIPKLFKENAFTPIPETECKYLEWNYQKQVGNYNYSRPFKIPEPILNQKMKYGQKLFGFQPTDIDKHLDDLQKFVNKFSDKITIRGYYNSAVRLVERIMFDYGCFDGVREYSGNDCDLYKSLIEFPRPIIPNNKPFKVKGKYYYIDLNGAYSSCANGIPHTLENDSKVNYKVVELWNMFHEERMKLKNMKNPIQTTIKYMMCAAYGDSIRKPKIFKKMMTDNV